MPSNVPRAGMGAQFDGLFILFLLQAHQDQATELHIGGTSGEWLPNDQIQG